MFQSIIQKIVLLLSLLLLSSTTIAQNAAQRKQLILADSLIYSDNFEKAHVLTDHLLESVVSDAIESQRFLLDVLQIKAQVYERQNKLDESLKLCLSIIDKANTLGHVKLMSSTQLTMALIYEKLDYYDRCNQALIAANQIILEHNLVLDYAHYCIRKSSYFVWIQEQDSSIVYAKKALEFANKYHQERHRNDAYLLLGHLNSKVDLGLSNKYYALAAKQFMHQSNYYEAGYMYINISDNLFKLGDLDQSLAYIDSAIQLYSLTNNTIPSDFHEMKSRLYHRLGEIDSAMVYANHRFEAYQTSIEGRNTEEINRLTIEFETEKKEADLRSQLEINRKQKDLLTRSIVLICVVVLTLTLLFLAYRKLKANNKKMNHQSLELKSSLEEKNVLLAEVQHRVKNNLQLIIALLDLQREAASDKSIEDITNESQKRIESISFLHDRIYLSKDLSHVGLQDYLREITALMQSSFEASFGHIKVSVTSEIDTISIEKAIPLGLITVELLNNSYKYAFKGRDSGEIRIRIHHVNTKEQTSLFVYSDDGVGYTGQSSNSGLGQEIIKGLVGQLHGDIVFDGSNGFEANISF